MRRSEAERAGDGQAGNTDKDKKCCPLPPPAPLTVAQCFRGLRNPQQRTGADGVPVEDNGQALGPSTAAELERVNSKAARRAGQKLQWKPLDMSASSDVAEIISPFNKAGPEAASNRVSLDQGRL